LIFYFENRETNHSFKGTFNFKLENFEYYEDNKKTDIMNVHLNPGDVAKRTLKLKDRKANGKMQYSCGFEVIETERDDSKILKTVKEKGEKHILDYNNKKVDIMFFV